MKCYLTTHSHECYWFMRMKRFILTAIMGSLVFSGLSQGNTDDRTWTYNSGSSLFAHITAWDSETDLVTLVDDKAKTSHVKRTELSLIDQAFVRQWFRIHEKMEAKLAELGGTLQHLQHTGSYITDYYVYQPSNYKADGSAPMMILFSPSGNGYGTMLRHFEAAEKTGFLLITLDVFKNRDDQAERLIRFKELLPQLEKNSHDAKKLFMGGLSGGAWRSYRYSGIIERPWAGIYATGGWLGYHLNEKYAKNHVHYGMRIAMVNGDRDRPVAQIEPQDTEYLSNVADCEVAMFAFEGGHQVPPTDSQVEAFEWLLEKDAND